MMWWDQTDGSPYGQSPIMEALSEIKMLRSWARQLLKSRSR
ncbi:hypothetical protein HGG75_10765 [Ochrobactrum pseudogrignonense]|nr:hypothetical protein [Brucella pseudogrignonensis]